MEVRKRYKYSPLVLKLRKAIIEEAKKSKHISSWFLPRHLMEVERCANRLCDKYSQADRDIVCLGVWFHDIGRLRGYDKKHDIYGAEEARKILSQAGLPSAKIEKVYEVCRSHKCEDVQPKSLEAKILATADAMSHFMHTVYLRLFLYYQTEMTFDESRILIRKKLERDFNRKIFFKEVKNQLRKKYEAMRFVLQD
ncbi:MAG: HD domain-containing protein [FCB group bacterium]|nr:HD domain-containing protein [FCB group bacterium]